MKNRRLLEKQLRENLNTISFSKKRFKALSNLISKKHNIPVADINVFIGGIKPLSEASEMMLYFILVSMCELLKEENKDEIKLKYPHNINASEYFSAKEIGSFEAWVYNTDAQEDIYPIVFENIIEIAPDQWVTSVDVDFLRNLYNNQIINYNRNTQRNLTIKNINGVETYHISIVKSSVLQIKEELKNGTFIPNAISLNLNLDNLELDYAVENNKLYVYSGQLDIIDGYHRFRAMMELKGEDPEFNYTFILNIMNFDEAKANAFIAQEDKRNKIKKNFVKSIDTGSLVYFIMNRLNTNPESAFYGQIGKYDKPIGQEQIFTLLNQYYHPTTRQEANIQSGRIMQLINYYCDKEKYYPNFRSLCIIIKASTLEKDVTQMYKIIKEFESNSNYLTMSAIRRKSVTRSVKQALEEIK